MSIQERPLCQHGQCGGKARASYVHRTGIASGESLYLCTLDAEGYRYSSGLFRLPGAPARVELDYPEGMEGYSRVVRQWIEQDDLDREGGA